MKYNLTKDDHRGDRLPHFTGKDSPRWVGDNITYSGVHKWIVREMGKPDFCEGCGIEEKIRYEWANISGKYKRDLADWIRLCAKCHKSFDGMDKKVWEVRRKNGTEKWRNKN